ncbi:MAG: hypothetical protein A3E88_02985 [Legionellales bacterium RIFCSPHIGHO2_12_FULL_35_11]|nr:MAG: hypothetical protein A3E88_02985 [Legionellales bacterium RIFCSPHIGHO2_12_FULL_35_11]
MAKKHGTNVMKRKGGNGVGSLMIVFVSFVFGYLFSSVCDVNQMGKWISAKVSSSDGKANNVPKVQAARPKPKLEFYTLLSQDNIRTTNIKPEIIASKPKELVPVTVDVNNNQKLAMPTPFSNDVKGEKPVASLNHSEKFMLQVGSFKLKSEAEKMRAELVIKGFDVSVSEVNAANAIWYRVMIGPFASRTEAQKIQTAFVRTENINGMLRKVDV